MSLWNQAVRRIGRRSVPWVAGASLLGAAIWSAYTPAQGDPAPASYSDAKQEELLVRLNFLNATWDKVLHEIADKTGSTLVMHDVPPGRFSRADWNTHSRPEAIQIVNRELEPLGYRVLAKDEFLTVMQIKRTRREYQRPVAPEDTYSAPPTVGMNRPPFGHTIGETRENQHRQEPQSRSLSQPSRSDRYPNGASEVRRDPSIKVASFGGEQTEFGTIEVTPRNRSAIDIARQVHSAFGNRSRLVEIGPSGLPAFTVAGFPDPQHPDSGAVPSLFTVEIDTDRNTLVVSGSTTIQQHLKGLFDSLDVSPLTTTGDTKLMSGQGQTAKLAQQLRGPLREIAAANNLRTPGPAGAPRMDLANGQVAFAQAPGDQPPMPPGQPGAQGNRNVLEANIGNLKGDVQIEALQDLDLLILRGNTDDVNKVMEVIRQVEQLAIGSLPEIHLLKLQHVDSQSLATLLTDVYQRLSELRNRNAQQQQASVAVIPVVTPNAVLILAPGNAMDSVLSLADELDQPVDPSHAVQVFRLKHAIAEDVVTMLEGFYEEQQGLRTRIRVSSDARTNSVILQANPRDMSELAAVIEKIDKDEAVAATQMKIFPLKSASSDEMARFLNAAIQSVSNPQSSTVFTSQTGGGAGGFGGFGGAQTTANQTPKSMVIEFLAEDGQRLLRSGLLADIRFNSDPRTNSLVVSAPAQSMPLIEELIDILDKPSSAVAEVKVFPLKNSDASEAKTLLDELFQTTTQQTGTQNQSTLGVNLMGTQDISNLIPLRFSVDTRTNSVVAYGGERALIAVEAILLRLDSSKARNRLTKVIRLHNSSSDNVALAINTFLQSRLDLLQLDPGRISSSELLQQEYVVTSEPTTNSLIISSTPEYLEQITELTTALDREPNQVMIQALIVEVTLNDNDEFGIELGFQDTTLFDRSLSTATGLMPGFAFNNQPLGNTNVRSHQIGSQGLSSFALGRTNTSLGYGGLVLSASSENVSVLVRALSAHRNVRILSRPQVLAMDNFVATINQGQEVPVVTGVNQTNFGFTQNVTREPAGIIIDVTPRVSPDGQVFMSVAAEKSQFDLANGVPIFTDGATGNTVTAPIKNQSLATTTVKVPDGQTIVLGGMITQTDTSEERKVPWIGDVPLVGNLFRFDQLTRSRTELLIFLTPRIIRGPGDFEGTKQVEADRLNWFQDEAEAMHGPIFGIPAEMSMPADLNGQFCPPGSMPYLNQPLPAEMVTPQTSDQIPYQNAPMQLGVPAPQPERVSP